MKARRFRLMAVLGLALVLALASTTLAAPLVADRSSSSEKGQGWGWGLALGRRLTVMVVDSGSPVETPEGGPRVLGVAEGWRMDDRPFADLDFLSRLLGWRLTWAVKNPLVTVDLLGGWGAGSWTPSPPSRPPQPPAADGRLTYGLYRLGINPLRLGFVVSNQGKRLVELSFPSGQEYDVVLRRGGEEMWRSSEEQGFITTVQAGVLEPGDARVYQEEVPALPPGDYVAEAYFLGVPPRDRPVASLELTLAESGSDLDRALSALDFEVSVRRGDSGSHDQAILRVHNPSAAEVRFWVPSGKLYDFAVTTEAGRALWRYSDGRSYVQAAQEVRLGHGVTKEYKADLPSLSKGRYRVEAYYGRFDTPMARCLWQVK